MWFNTNSVVLKSFIEGEAVSGFVFLDYFMPLYDADAFFFNGRYAHCMCYDDIVTEGSKVHSNAVFFSDRMICDNDAEFLVNLISEMRNNNRKTKATEKAEQDEISKKTKIFTE